MYGGDKFAKEVQQYIALVEEALTTADDATIGAIQEHFCMSCFA
jgi:thiaminase